MIAVPPAALDAAVDEAIAAGARALVVITGPAADGDAGGARDRALAERRGPPASSCSARTASACSTPAPSSTSSPNELPRGPIGLISQSGNLALEIGMLAADAGLGFSRFASVGNQADVGIAELIGGWLATQPTRADRGLRGGLPRRARVRARRGRGAAGKPVVLLAIEHTEATARAVASHTGALARAGAAIDAACRDADRARAAHRSSWSTPPTGCCAPARWAGGGSPCCPTAAATAGSRRRCRAGGPRAAGVQRGLRGGAARRPAAGRGGRRTRSTSPAAASRTSQLRPHDRGAAALGRGRRSADQRLLRRLRRVREPMRGAELEVVDALAAAARASGRPLVVQTMHPQTAACAALRAAAYRCSATIERAVGAIAALADRCPPGGRRRALPRRAGDADDGYTAARAAARRGGVPFVAARTVTDAAAAARQRRARALRSCSRRWDAAQVRRRRRRARPRDEDALAGGARRHERAARAARVHGRADGAAARRRRAAVGRAGTRASARRARRRSAGSTPSSARHRGRARAGRRGARARAAAGAARRAAAPGRARTGRRSTRARRQRRSRRCRASPRRIGEIAAIEVNPLLACRTAVGLDARLELA